MKDSGLSPQPLGISRGGSVDFVSWEEDSLIAGRLPRLKKIIQFQTWVIVPLVVVLLVLIPLAQPIYTYYALRPDKQVMPMLGLGVPNLTNRAILSWATTSVTEVMTVGFGDIDVKLPKQKRRFTSSGWDAYAIAFDRAEMGQHFKQNQLVLTTVPSDTPVIVGQGLNVDGVYQWNVQMPVIMTYATNNNKTKQERHIIALSIIRIPAEQDAMGIAIDKWNVAE